MSLEQVHAVEPITVSGVYERTDGTYARYRWVDGLVVVGKAYPTPAALHEAEDAEERDYLSWCEAKAISAAAENSRVIEESRAILEATEA